MQSSVAADVGRRSRVAHNGAAIDVRAGVFPPRLVAEIFQFQWQQQQQQQ